VLDDVVLVRNHISEASDEPESDLVFVRLDHGLGQTSDGLS